VPAVGILLVAMRRVCGCSHSVARALNLFRRRFPRSLARAEEGLGETTLQRALMPIHRMILFLRVAQGVVGTRESTRGSLGGHDAAGTRRQPGARPGRRGHAEAASRKEFAGMLESARTRLIDARNNSLDSIVARSFSPSTRRS
jgi:hypothetical protein